jgi:hypothetical protein
MADIKKNKIIISTAIAISLNPSTQEVNKMMLLKDSKITQAKQVTIRVPTTTLEQLQQAAADRGQSFNSYINALVDDALNCRKGVCRKDYSDEAEGS